MQLPGQVCWVCDQTISGRLTGRFCTLCGVPIHTNCIQEKLLGSGNRCPECGAKPRIISAWSDRHERYQAGQAQADAVAWRGSGTNGLLAGIVLLFIGIGSIPFGFGLLLFPIWFPLALICIWRGIAMRRQAGTLYRKVEQEIQEMDE
jgi:hypothetical protein